MIDSTLWKQVNLALIAKSIAELHYEKALSVVSYKPGEYALHLKSGRAYCFSANEGIWGRLNIDPGSLIMTSTSARQAENQAGGDALDAGQFFVNAQSELELSDADLGNLLHETANTLAADMLLRQARKNHSARAMAFMADEQLQCLLDGHPKAIVNKGRIGWGAEDYQRYAPECSKPRALVWLAVDATLCKSGIGVELGWASLLDDSFSTGDPVAARLQSLIGQGYLPLPVHPWQWQHYIRHHYAALLATEQLIYLGPVGDEYLPQVSLRTLSNHDRPGALHIKLPITILNTSCFRGIPGDFIHCGPELSAWMASLCAKDAELQQRGTAVMEEIAGVHVPQVLHNQLDASPYRYKEMLGATWRQSPASHCKAGERHMLMAALLQCDESGKSIASALIEESGIRPEQWLSELFTAVMVPLYHLLCAYGVGLVAHAQNLTVMLAQHRPKRVLLKDFQGDLRVLDSGVAERAGLPASADVVKRLPGNYLIHDLYTGHCVTVLRFLSAQLAKEGVIAELDFYRQLAKVLRDYQGRHPGLAPVFAELNLFAAKIERVCINRVRLKEGYGDSAQRPVPIVDGFVDNPLYLADCHLKADSETTLKEVSV
jgi:aerobactin synthase